MPTSISVLIGFVGWTIVLVLGYVNYRLFKIGGGQPADSWTRGNPSNDPDVIKRMQNAHLNCVENLPLYGGVVLAGLATNQLAIIDPLAGWYLAARIAQSVVHVIQVSHWAVMIRGTLWTVQMLLLLYWVLALAHVI